MALRRLNIIAAILVAGLVPRPALAHRDYEETIGSVQGSRDRPLSMTLHYTDGIMVTDPVKFVLYDSARMVVSETGYYRDVLVCTNGAGEVYAFGLDGWSVLFRHAWRIDDDRLVPVASAACYGYVMVAAAQAHWLGYLVSLVFLVGGGWISCFPSRRDGARSRVGESLFSCGLIWVTMVFMYGRLSVPLIVSLAMLLTLPCWGPRLRWELAKRTSRPGT